MRLSISAQNTAVAAVFPTTTTFYLSLHTSDPGTTGSGEASVTRQAITFAVPVGGSALSTNSQVFPTLPAGLFTFCGLWDSVAGGNYVAGAQLGEAISGGVPLTITTAAISARVA